MYADGQASEPHEWATAMQVHAKYLNLPYKPPWACFGPPELREWLEAPGELARVLSELACQCNARIGPFELSTEWSSNVYIRLGWKESGRYERFTALQFVHGRAIPGRDPMDWERAMAIDVANGRIQFTLQQLDNMIHDYQNPPPLPHVVLYEHLENMPLPTEEAYECLAVQLKRRMDAFLPDEHMQEWQQLWKAFQRSAWHDAPSYIMHSPGYGQVHFKLSVKTTSATRSALIFSSDPSGADWRYAGVNAGLAPPHVILTHPDGPKQSISALPGHLPAGPTSSSGDMSASRGREGGQGMLPTSRAPPASLAASASTVMGQASSSGQRYQHFSAFPTTHDGFGGNLQAHFAALNQGQRDQHFNAFRDHFQRSEHWVPAAYSAHRLQAKLVHLGDGRKALHFRIGDEEWKEAELARQHNLALPATSLRLQAHATPMLVSTANRGGLRPAP